MTDSSTRPEPATGTFAALRHRDFRLLFCGMLIGSLSMPMNWVAQMWLVLDLAGKEHAPFWLGVTGFARGVPLLVLSLYGGALADRLDRRRLLFISQTCSLLTAALTALLVGLGLVNLPLLLVLILANSTVTSFDQPTRQALLPDLVPPHLVPNAVALNSMAMYVSTAAGPSLAGFLIEGIGVPATFSVIACTYVAVLVAIVLMRAQSRPVATARQSMLRQLGEGWEYVRGEPVVLWLITITFAITGIGMAFTNLTPILVRDHLGADARGMGLVFGAWGIGSVVVSLLLAMRLQQMRGKGGMVLLMSVLFTAGVGALAYSPTLLTASFSQFFTGAANTALMVTGNTAVLAVTPAAVRGRVMGIYMVNRGLMPVGALAAGFVGSFLGVQAGIATMGLLSLALVLIATVLQPGVWRRLDAAVAGRPRDEGERGEAAPVPGRA